MGIVKQFGAREFWGQRAPYRQARRTVKPVPKTTALAAKDPETKIHYTRQEKIEIVTLLRTAPDVGQWRAALMMAESKERPDRRLLYSTYKEIVLDPHLTSVMERIKMKCTNHRIHFYRDGRVEEGCDVDALCQKPYFFKLVEHILESRWFGHSLVECNFLLNKDDEDEDMDDGVALVPRQNVRPEFRDIIRNQGDYENTIKYREGVYRNFLIEVGDSTDLGLLNNVAPSVLYKRYGVKDWAEFLEVYGMPIREIQYDPNIPGARDEAVDSMKAQGSNAGIATPAGSSFRLHDSAKAGNSQAFSEAAAFHNGEISKCFLLQTMTTESGSSLSQGEVHLEAEKEAIQAYRLFVEMVLNHKLLPLLRRHGFNVEGKFQYDDRPRLSKVAMADLLVKLQSIADIPMSWVYETFGIPAPQSGDDIKDNPAARSHMSGTQGDENKVERKTLALSLPEQPCCEDEALALDTTPISAEEEALLARVFAEQQRTGTVPRQYFSALAQQLLKGVGEGAGDPAPATDFDSPDHLFRSLMEANVQRFSAAKSLAIVQQLNELKNTASSFAEFKEKAGSLLNNYNLNWMKSEYDHAISYAQNGANYLRQREIQDEYPYWRYETVGDDRVRASHAALDGMVFRFGDEASDRVYPPNGYGCRCEAIPTSDEGQATSTLSDAASALGEDWDVMVTKGFDRSPDVGEVFKRSMEYVKNFNPNGLDWRAFALQSALQRPGLRKLSREKPPAAADWLAERRTEGLTDAISIEDFRGRPMLIPDNVAEAAANRGQAFALDAAQQAITAPDEVWMTQSGQTILRRAVAFFQGEAVTVSSTLRPGMQETVQAISVTDLPDTVRSGILVHQK